MISRRAFLMAALGGTAMGCVAISTTLLRKGGSPKADRAATAVPHAGTAVPHAGTGVPHAGTAPSPAPLLTPSAQPTPTLSGACPAVIARATWGALEPDLNATGEHGLYDARANPDGWLVYDRPLADVLHTIIVHHSALPLTDGPREIQALHMHDKGFADVGYHYIIDERGKLYEGRSMTVRGAHTYAHNFGTVGICLMGNFEAVRPTEVQLLTLREQIRCLLGQYPRIDRIAGHRDYNPGLTLCPGAHLAELLPGIADEMGLASGA